MKEIYFAGGCFWGTEHYLKQIRGVLSTRTGYANGITENPTYKDVCTDTTRFAETVHVTYDPEVLSTELQVRLYLKAVDPTSVNRQGEDTGTQYRTGNYYVDESDLPVIKKVFDEVQSEYSLPLAVEVMPLENFYLAEDYHQDYLDKNPAGYCHLPVALFEYARKAN